jgi:hypothetical protein
MRLKIGVALGLVLIVIAIAMVWSLSGNEEAQTYAYSELLADAAAGRVDWIVQDETHLTVWLVGETEPRVVRIASDAINVYAEVCAAAGAGLGECPIGYEALGTEAGQWLGLIITALLPVLLIGAIIYLLMRQSMRGTRGKLGYLAVESKDLEAARDLLDRIHAEEKRPSSEGKHETDL